MKNQLKNMIVHLCFPWMLALITVMLPMRSLGLEEYFLDVDQEHLDSLYAHPLSSMEYPAVLTCSAGTADCFVRFRGKSTLSFPKKSWAIIFPDHSFLGRERLNLNSEYMDPGMMRNFIAMRTSELMGFPASRTSYAKLFINGENAGVYLDIERVDSLYFNRYGLFPQVVFKAQMEGARFMQLPSGVSQLQAYRPRGDGELFISRLENFIDCIHAGVEPLPVDVGNLLGYYAVNLALVEKDSGSNNYYLTLGSDGKWRVFPWDRGSCLGSLSSGEFLPELADDTALRYFRENSLYQRLVLSPANMQTFELYMNQATALLSNEIPLLLDSIYNQIRFDLYDDPLSQWTPEEIAQAYEDLVWFVANRAEFLSDNMLVPETASLIELDISDPWLDAGEAADITIWISSPFETARLKWMVGSEGHFLSMIPVNGFEGLKWTISFLMTDEVDHCPLSFLFNTSTGGRQYFYYPSYSLGTYAYMRSAHPCIVRPAPGSSTPGDSGNCNFSVLVPEVYGPDLWALPLVNESGVDVDISCCVFVFGDSPNRIFLPPGTVAGAGDTLFLTNSLSLFQAEFPVRTAFGNCASSAPGSGTLTMLGPDWGQLWTRPVPAQMEEHLASSPLMVTEINCMPSQEYNCGDWVEFYNPGDTIIDIGGFSLRDSEGNRCIVPMNTVVEPGGFRVLVREQYLFQSCFSVCDVSVPGLGFGLDSQFDSLSVYDRSGRLLLCVDWDMEAFHPSGRDGVLGLVAPGLSLWELAPFPGTPGEPNRLWDAGCASLNLASVFPNPTLSGSISFEYTTTTWPVRAFVMDLSGRIVVDLGVLDQVGGSHCVEMPGNTSAGIYFLVLQSCGGITAGRFTSL